MSFNLITMKAACEAKMGLLDRLKKREQGAIVLSPEFDDSRRQEAAEYHYKLGLAALEQSLYEEALTEFKQAVRKGSDTAEAQYNMGLACAQLNRSTEAIQYYERAIKISSDFVEAYNNLGLIYSHLGHNIEAMKAFIRAIRLKPDYVEAHNNLGVVYYNCGSYAEAVKSCKKAVQIKPEYPHAHYSLGLVYLDLRDRDRAMEEQQILKDLDPTMAVQLLDAIHREFLTNSRHNWANTKDVQV
jgi:tetratricopeptide (TPR) repeat protein